MHNLQLIYHGPTRALESKDSEFIENRKEIQKNVAKKNTKGKPSTKYNKADNRFSKSVETNQNEPSTSSEYKDEFQLPNFITKSFTERLSL